MIEESDLILNNDNDLMQLITKYMETKGDSFEVLSLEERVKLFLALIKDCDYTKSSFAKVEEFKQTFFAKEEIEKIGVNNLSDYLISFVVGEKNTKQNKLIVLYAPNGIKKEESINKENATAFEVSFKNHTVKTIDIKLLKSKIIYDTYKTCKKEKLEKEQENCELQNLNNAFEKYLMLTAEKQA